MTEEQNRCTTKSMQARGMSCGAYGMAFVGAAVYYIQHSTTFWEGAFGIVKAIIWPAMLIYKVLEYLKM